MLFRSTVTTTTEVTETVEVGLAWRLKAGCQLEAETGVFMCPVGETNAVYEPYQPQPMPEWMQDRVTMIFLTPQSVAGLPIPVGIEHKKLMNVGAYSIWWVKGEAEALKGLHVALWAMNPTSTLGALAAVETLGESFYDQRVAKATGMTTQQFTARRAKLVTYLNSQGYTNTSALAAATSEDALIRGLVTALNHTMADLWAAMQ